MPWPPQHLQGRIQSEHNEPTQGACTLAQHATPDVFNGFNDYLQII